MTSVLIVAGKPNSLINFRGQLIVELIRRGYDVHACAPGLSPANDVGSQLESWGVAVHEVELHRTSINPLGDLRYGVQLYKLMRQLKPDHVLSYTAKPVIYGGLAAALAGVPNRHALITGLGYAFIESAKIKRLFTRWVIEKLYKVALAHANVIFFQNPDDRALFRQRGIIKNGEGVVVNGSGVELKSFSQLPVQKQSIVFLFVGRLIKDKGISEFVDAAKKIKDSYPHAEFHVAGGIDINPNALTECEIKQWSDNGVIKYLGRLDDVRPALGNATVFVLPSYREGTPRSVLEAMAVGRAVITTDAPGCRETVIDGENGFLVGVKSVDDLVTAMLRFLRNPGLASAMGERSRQIAEEKYDVNKVNHVMLQAMGL